MGKRQSEMVQVAVRMPAAWVKRLDEIADVISPDGEISRNAAVRMSLKRGLETYERELKIKKGERR